MATPDSNYLRGAAEALAEVRRRLTVASNLGEPVAVGGQIWQLLRDAAAELGVDETAQVSASPSPPAAEQPSAQGSPWVEAVQTLSGRFEIEGIGSEVYGGILVRHNCGAWQIQIDTFPDGPTDLAELVRRAAEHTEVCR